MLSFRQPHVAVVLLLIAAEIGFTSAALWQWRRAEFKDRRAVEFAAALSVRDAAPVPDFIGLLGDSADFRAARLRGHLLVEHVLLLDNQMRAGEYGVDVYVPLVLEGGGHVLVNLGWIAADRSRRNPALVGPLPADFDASGLIAPAPAAGLLSDLAIDADADAPQLVLAIVPHQIAAALQLSPMLGRVFLPAPAAGSRFRRDWAPAGMSADRHRGYALQWASFAAACLILFLILHLRRKEAVR